MNKILQILFVVLVSTVAINTQSANVTDQMDDVARMGNELFYELIEMKDTKSVANLKESSHIAHISCKDLAFCRAHEDCNQYSRKDCSGPFWNRKCKTVHYYKGQCTNNLWYIAEFDQRGKFNQMPFRLDNAEDAELIRKNNQTVVLKLNGKVRYMGSVDLKRVFKGYRASKRYDFDQKVPVTLTTELTQDSEGQWKAQLKSQDVDADFGSYNFDIEDQYKDTARKLIKGLIVDKIIKQSLLPSQSEIESYLNEKVNSLLRSM